MTIDQVEISTGFHNKGSKSTAAHSVGQELTNANKSVPDSDTAGAMEFIIHRE
jgi:hypothetical protein